MKRWIDLIDISLSLDVLLSITLVLITQNNIPATLANLARYPLRLANKKVTSPAVVI